MFSSRKTAADFTFSIPCNRLCHLVTDNTTKTILNHRKFMSGVVDVLKWEEGKKKKKLLSPMCSKILFYSEHHLYHIAYRNLHFHNRNRHGHHKDLFVLWWVHTTKAKVLLNQNTIDIKKKRPLADYWDMNQ